MSESWATALASRPPPPATDPGGPVVVVSAHPDDEVLAVGAWLAAQRDRDVVFVTVTDGEASHPGSPILSPDDLRRLRSKELLVALGELGVESPVVHRLRLPDGEVTGRSAELEHLLRPLTDPARLIIAPYQEDGHPDHEAVGRAAAAVCGSAQSLWQMPIWAWTRPGRDTEWLGSLRTLPSGPIDRVRKWRAVNAFETQTRPIGPGESGRAVVGGALLEHALAAPEVVIV